MKKTKEIKVNFKIKEVMEKVNKYMNSKYESHPRQKDFFNFRDFSFTCGKCNKKISATRALFHFHLPHTNK